MSEFRINLKQAAGEVGTCRGLARSIGSIQSDLNRTMRSLDFSISQKERIRKRLEMQSDALKEEQRMVQRAASSLQEIVRCYEQTEKGLCGVEDKNISKLQTFVNEFKENYGWKEILSGAGYIGTLYNFANDIKNGKTWQDFAKQGVKVRDFISEAAKTYNNYKKIGNAVGAKKAMTWWVKKITGFRPLGRASTAKNPFTRFCNNLTNKTSPFHAQFKDVIDTFKGAKGVGKAVASWGAVAVNGVLNWFSNKEEQANSNGTMSDGRVWAETIMETAVDTALTYGASIVVGAAVTAALGTVAAPGILVVAASGAVIAGLNAGVKALTGKTTTEWISDTILDAGEAIGKAVGNAAKNVSSSIGRWFGRLSFT